MLLALQDLKNKFAIVAGGLGLIGQKIVNALQFYECSVVILDKYLGDDLTDFMAIDSFFEFDPDIFINASYPKNFDDHVKGYWQVTERFAGYMGRKGRGSIINFASIYGSVAPRYWIYEGTRVQMPTWYAVAKAGIIQMSKVLAAKYAPQGVRINCISPGGIYDNQPQEFVDNYCKLTPMGRMGTPEDMVGAVLFLASDLSCYITGINLIVDGGFSL